MVMCTMNRNNKLVDTYSVSYPGHDLLLLGMVLSQIFPTGHVIMRLAGYEQVGIPNP